MTTAFGRAAYARRLGAGIAGLAFTLACLYSAWAAGNEGAAVVAHTYRGPAVAIGNGTARTVVLTDRANAPVAIAVEFTAGMLGGLPPRPNAGDPMLDWAYYLDFPRAAPATGFDHVMINWHPMGHVPPGIYDVAHFDFHFYLVGRQDQLAIHYAHPETPDVADVTMPPAALIPPGYSIPPGTQVSRMGLHAVPAAAPEFHHGKFANTLIYGYDQNGRLAFLEPMVAIDYLKRRPSEVQAVAVPARYSLPGEYPARYSVTYDPQRQTYRVVFDRLTPWQGPQAAK
ncbi:MAG TPA: hypothetical protein VJR70_02155 [Stellaceae bacterium]|nr:hypothetical protein [Stellaceae bacterium]